VKIEFGNILDVQRGIIVQGCNARGRMDRGVAKQVRDVYPEIFGPYAAHCRAQDLRSILGQITAVEVKPDLFVVNAITQLDYGKEYETVRFVNYRAVADAFERVRELAIGNNLPVHYPQIGAGRGGGDWSVISSIIAGVLDRMDEVPELGAEWLDRPVTVFKRVEHTLWLAE